MDYEFPGWDVVEGAEEHRTLEARGSDLSVSWRDFFGEAHVIQFEADSRAPTYAFFPTGAHGRRQGRFTWYDGENWTDEAVGAGC